MTSFLFLTAGFSETNDDFFDNYPDLSTVLYILILDSVSLSSTSKSSLITLI